MTNDFVEWPRITKALVVKLNEICPPESPKVTQSNREIWIQVGKRQMVEALIAQHEAQNRDAKQN